MEGAVKLNISKDFIILNDDSNNKWDVFRKLCKPVYERGYVEKQYIEKLIEREKQFPTGLETFYPIAIPHVEKFCKEPFLAISTIKESVTFYSMGEPDKELDVKVVFLFGITNPKDQVKVLKNFMIAFQNEKALKELIEAKDEEQLIEIVKSFLKDGLAVEA